MSLRTETDAEARPPKLDAERVSISSSITTPGGAYDSSVSSASRQNAQSSEESEAPAPPYSVFVKSQKWAIVFLATFATMISPLAASIYFPAIPSLANAFHKTTQDINITVTIYMIFQGIAPSVWGAVADSYGRRPIYICCLALFAVIQFGLAVIPTSAYAALLVLRCFSAAGSAPIIALGAGTVGDIAAPAERGKYMGLVFTGTMVGPCIGPVFGGLLNQRWGWRAIFWFMAIFSVSILVAVVLFLPETLRSMVGNGSVPARGMSRTVWAIFAQRRKSKDSAPGVPTETSLAKPARKNGNPFIALTYILEKDVAIILFYNGLNCAVFYAILTSLSTVVEDSYGLSTSKTGLTFLPVGFGMFVSNIITGRLLDREFRRIRRQMDQQKEVDDRESSASTSTPKSKEPIVTDSRKMDPNDLLQFPIEHARLRLMPFYSIVFWVSTIAYGWLLQTRQPLEAALIMQFIAGYCVMAILQISQVMLVDLYPAKSASVTANNNLCRCIISAIGTAVIDPMRRAVGMGWTLVIFVAFGALLAPFMVLEWNRGMRWRQERAARDRRREELQNDREQARASATAAVEDEKTKRATEFGMSRKSEQATPDPSSA